MRLFAAVSPFSSNGKWMYESSARDRPNQHPLHLCPLYELTLSFCVILRAVAAARFGVSQLLWSLACAPSQEIDRWRSLFTTWGVLVSRLGGGGGGQELRGRVMSSRREMRDASPSGRKAKGEIVTHSIGKSNAWLWGGSSWSFSPLVSVFCILFIKWLPCLELFVFDNVVFFKFPSVCVLCSSFLLFSWEEVF